ncbi:MAG: SsrA-binding protein SmpB [Paludibacteraceae bacterium]|nr:SsrA-binding protein SmpB [Paludibacteraceae bacterium]
MNGEVYIKNKKAGFDFELLDKYTAGIVLQGTEIKSLRQGRASLVDSYCYFIEGELWIKSMNIPVYFYGTYSNHIPTRDRKLLLNKKELRKLQRAVKEPGFSIVPTAIFINDKGLAKVNISLAKGKKEFDKRESIKEAEDKRIMDRARKYRSTK